MVAAAIELQQLEFLIDFFRRHFRRKFGFRRAPTNHRETVINDQFVCRSLAMFNCVGMVEMSENFLLQCFGNPRRRIRTLMFTCPSVLPGFAPALFTKLFFGFNFEAGPVFTAALQALNSAATGKLFTCDVFVFM